MADTIVKVPKNKKMDYDYIAFSFDGLHSVEDFGVYRISDNNEGYSSAISSTMTDKTAEIAGMDGQYFFGTQHKPKIFNIKIAFDNLAEDRLQKMKQWLNGKKLGDLWFAEEPYKVYTAKVTGSSTLTSIAFQTESGDRVYKGNGTIQFTCYNPYARTPDYVLRDTEKGTISFDGKHYSSYADFSQVPPRVLPGVPGGVHPYGDLPFNFVADLGDLDDSVTLKKEVVLSATASGTTYTITSDSTVQNNGVIEVGGQK